MAVVRCTGGGKSRSLKEIANKINRGINLPHMPVSVLYISYSEHSFVRDEEKSNPLQALCRRIAFEASIDPGQCNNRQQAFETFYEQGYIFDPWEIKEWLGNSSVILNIDDADMLMDQKTDYSQVAKYGEFLKTTFVTLQNRFLIFSLRTISKVTTYEGCMTQTVKLQLLPYVYSLNLAIRKLDRNLGTPRQIVRFGQLPGLLYKNS
ncbi:hypothetical protein MPSEU_001039600 [Mayamaea pseudoterrestris]|nr:hypothetical protein MPSEU_001039600 [Mayamaea pseudoterrestris]